MVRLPAVFALLLCAPAASADAAQEDDPVGSTSEVNEGELNILAQAPGEPAHHHVNLFKITEESLVSGWVGMEQCHYDIDPVPSAEILFTEGRVRDIAVVRSDNIRAVRVERHSVQMQDVDPGAVLCIRAETLALSMGGDGYAFHSGPYMRRFLDGYFPMHVSLGISFPEMLEPVDIVPPAQPGVSITHKPGRLALDTWFEGILEVRLRFEAPEGP